MDTDWRRIDIDQYDPDRQFEPDDLGLEQKTAEQLQPTVQQIRQLTAQLSIVDAIKLAAQDPPYGSSKEVTGGYLSVVLDALNAAKQSEVPKIVAGLSLEEVDTLVKFVYSLMATPEGQKSGGSLLGWLDKIVDYAGEGPIIRYMSDPYKL